MLSFSRIIIIYVEDAMKKIILLCSLLFTSIFAFASVMPNDRGVTPLMKACISGDLPLVKKLIKEGADVNATSSFYHRTALLYCLSDYPSNIRVKDTKTLVNYRRKAAWLLLKTGAKVKISDQRGLTPLLAASSWMKPDFIAELLKQGANIEARTEYSGNTPLINALKKNNIEVVKLLLDHGADPNARAYGNTAAIFFAKSLETVKLLISEGVKLNCRKIMSSQYSDNRFKILKSISILEDWASWADLKLIKMALDEHCPITVQVLINAAKNYKNPEVFPLLLKYYKNKEKLNLGEILNNAVDYDNIKLLLEKGANPNYADNYGRTRLIYSAMSSDRDSEEYKTVKLLLENGANPNIADKQGKTPLIWLMWRVGSVDIAEALIAHGAKINTKDMLGRTALLTLITMSYNDKNKILALLNFLLKYKADFNSRDRNGASALLLALGHEQSTSVIKRLLELNQPVNIASKNNITPLMLAARHYDAEIVKLLLEREAKVNATDDTNWTPLMYAAEYWPVSYGCAVSATPKRRNRKDPQETIELLLKYGAKPDIADKYGNTPLIEAARWANAKTLNLLIKHSKKDFVNARDKRGCSALMRAVRDNPDNNAIKALITAGAKCEIMMNYNKFQKRINFRIKDGLVSSKETRSIYSNERCPPLFRAVLTGKKDIVKFMLEHGANPNWQYRKNKEERPISPMAYCRDPKIAAFLIKAGAKGKAENLANTNKQEKGKTSLLHDNSKIVNTLVKNIINDKHRKKNYHHYITHLKENGNTEISGVDQRLLKHYSKTEQK
jgi:ankyrin repeat protein